MLQHPGLRVDECASFMPFRQEGLLSGRVFIPQGPSDIKQKSRDWRQWHGWAIASAAAI